jgi:hypothetical protein
VRTDAVICTAGSWSQRIGEMAGVLLPVVPIRRQIGFTGPLMHPMPTVPFTLDLVSTLLPPLDPLPDDHAAAAAFWWRILDQLSPQTPNQDVASPEAVPPARRKTTRPFDQQPPLPRSAPPPARRKTTRPFDQQPPLPHSAPPPAIGPSR